MPALENRYDFVYLFDVTDGNPNGDPDAGNQPRVDPETGQGLVTDVCLKRKVRNAVMELRGDTPGFEVYFQTQDAPTHLRILNRQHQRAHDAVAVATTAPVEVAAAAVSEETPAGKAKGKGKAAEKGPPKSADATELARKWMCKTFFDIRAFGAVMTTGVNCGQVRGPVQVTFARSVGPILSLEHAITRKSVTTEEDAEKQAKADGSITGTIGRKMTVPYGLYVARGFVSPSLAAQTGFGDDDLALLWRSLARMFEFDRSATRGQMSARGLYLFKHESRLGNAASHALQDRVTAERRAGVTVARSFADFTVDVDRDGLPKGVELIEYDCETFADEPVPVAAGQS